MLNLSHVMAARVALRKKAPGAGGVVPEILQSLPWQAMKEIWTGVAETNHNTHTQGGEVYRCDKDARNSITERHGKVVCGQLTGDGKGAGGSKGQRTQEGTGLLVRIPGREENGGGNEDY